MFAYKALKSVLENSAIDTVVPVATFTLTPVSLVLPIEFVLIPTKSVLKSIFSTLTSWSFVNLSTGSNNRFLVPVVVISVLRSPNLDVVKSVVLSNKITSSSSVKTTTSLNCVSKVSGSTICIR